MEMDLFHLLSVRVAFCLRQHAVDREGMVPDGRPQVHLFDRSVHGSKAAVVMAVHMFQVVRVAVVMRLPVVVRVVTYRQICM